jgi:hypothetical protein
LLEGHSESEVGRFFEKRDAVLEGLAGWLMGPGSKGQFLRIWGIKNFFTDSKDDILREQGRVAKSESTVNLSEQGVRQIESFLKNVDLQLWHAPSAVIEADIGVTVVMGLTAGAAVVKGFYFLLGMGFDFVREDDGRWRARSVYLEVERLKSGVMFESNLALRTYYSFLGERSGGVYESGDAFSSNGPLIFRKSPEMLSTGVSLTFSLLNVAAASVIAFSSDPTLGVIATAVIVAQVGSSVFGRYYNSYHRVNLGTGGGADGAPARWSLSQIRSRVRNFLVERFQCSHAISKVPRE